MTEPTFVPPDWSGDLLDALRTNTVIRRLGAADPRALETIPVKVPRPPEWMAQRDEFVARWQALTAEGEEAGFLARAVCYECEGALEPETLDYTYERRSNPDYDPDYVPPSLRPTVTIPRA